MGRAKIYEVLLEKLPKSKEAWNYTLSWGKYKEYILITATQATWIKKNTKAIHLDKTNGVWCFMNDQKKKSIGFHTTLVRKLWEIEGKKLPSKKRVKFRNKCRQDWRIANLWV